MANLSKLWYQDYVAGYYQNIMGESMMQAHFHFPNYEIPHEYMDVAHYNLPDDQQAAIEHHLNVHAWPTYKLFDRDGNLMDLKVDARDLEGLASLLEKMK